MSLIADALKAAQKEKARRSPPPRVQQQGYFPFRFPTRGSGEPIVSPIVIGLGVATAAIALTMLVLVFSPSRKPERPAPALAQFSDSVPTTMVLDTPGDTNDLGLVGGPTDDASDPLVFDEYEDLPPVRSAVRSPGRTTSPAADPAQRAENGAGSDPLPSIDGPAPARSASQPGGRLEITVDRPIQSSQGGGLFEQGLAAQRRGDYETAKNRYLQATYEQPRSLELWNNLGTVYRALRDLSGAEGAFRTATEIDKTFAPAWSNLGIVLAQQGRAQESMAALQEAVRLDPTNSGAKVNLAIQLHAAGAVADARRLLEEAVRADPAMAEAHYELGRVLEKMNDRAGAVREYKIFLDTAGGRLPAQEQAVRARLLRLES